MDIVKNIAAGVGALGHEWAMAEEHGVEMHTISTRVRMEWGDSAENMLL